MRKKTITLSVVAVLLAATASFGGIADVEYFDFTGWDHDLIDSGGQTFEDICGDMGDVDVTVESIGEFDSPSTAFGPLIQSNHPTTGSHSFRFTFSRPLRLVIATLTVDPLETQSIFTSSTETYIHESGAAPTVTPDGSGIAIKGNGFGINETGAAFGETLIGEPVTVLTITYATDPGAVNKFGQWMVGKVVPEPNSIALLGIGGLGMLLQLRKRRK